MFDRTRRSVSLTEAGMRILPDIQAGLDTLARAVDNTAGLGKERSLTISVAPSFASKWLLPRLADFSERYPDIDLRISATVALADLKRDHVDLAIRLGHGPYANARSEPLFSASGIGYLVRQRNHSRNVKQEVRHDCGSDGRMLVRRGSVQGAVGASAGHDLPLHVLSTHHRIGIPCRAGFQKRRRCFFGGCSESV